MSIDQVKDALEAIARDLRLGDREPEVELSRRWIHVVFTSDAFRGMTQGQRENLVWREFERRLDDETILAITQCYLLTPEEREEALAR